MQETRRSCARKSSETLQIMPHVPRPAPGSAPFCPSAARFEGQALKEVRWLVNVAKKGFNTLCLKHTLDPGIKLTYTCIHDLYFGWLKF